MKHCLECLIYLLNGNKPQGVNGEVKLFVKIYSNYDPGIQTSITLVIFFVLTWWIIEFEKNIWLFSFITSNNFSFLLNMTYTFKAVFPRLHLEFTSHAWWIIEFKKNIWLFSFINSISFKPNNFSFLLIMTYTLTAVFLTLHLEFTLTPALLKGRSKLLFSFT